jgi:hypothetical protein
LKKNSAIPTDTVSLTGGDEKSAHAAELTEPSRAAGSDNSLSLLSANI